MAEPSPAPAPAASVTAADGVRLAVHEFDGGGDVTAVLAHATGFHGLVWLPLARALRWRCLAPDLRGHGDSARPADFDWRGFAGDVLAVVDAFGLPRPVGAGHSSGATALLLAEQAAPGTFAGLYCYEPVIVPVDPPLGRDPDSWLAQATRRRRARFDSRELALDHYGSKPPLAVLDEEVLRAYVDHGLQAVADGSWRLKCDPQDEAAVYEMATAHDAYPNLGAVRCPVTLAYGGRSEAFSRAHAEEVAAALPHARVEEHSALGHLGPLEDPVGVADKMRRALPT